MNTKSPIEISRKRLTALQRKLLGKCDRDGGLRIALRDSKSRRAAARLRELGLMEWIGTMYHWRVTHAGRELLASSGTTARLVREAVYSDYVRAN